MDSLNIWLLMMVMVVVEMEMWPAAVTIDWTCDRCGI